MGATSVTGTGLGAADGLNKGSEHMSLGVKRLIGPHIVAAGTVTLSGTTATVEIPPQTNIEGKHYMVLLTANNGAVWSTTGVNETAWTFNVTAAVSGAVVWWAVVLMGL